MKKVISLVLNNFKNDSRVLKEAISLQKQGYGVTVVALDDGTLVKREKTQGIQIHRLTLVLRRCKKNAFVHLIKYTHYFLKVLLHYRQADIIHCNDLSTLPVGVAIKIFCNRRAKIVYDAHEYETEMNGLRGWRQAGYRLLEKILIRHADAVLTVSDAIGDAYAKLYGIAKPFIVLNAPPWQEPPVRNLFRTAFNLRDDQVIHLYQGAFTPGRGLDILLETFAALPDDRQVLVLMGYGPLAADIEAADRRSPHIFHHAAVPPQDVLDYTASADIGLSFIQNTCLSYYYCLPNKLFEYTMAGLPVIVSDLPEMAGFVRRNQLGVVARTADGNGLTEALAAMGKLDLVELKANARCAAQTFNWEAQEKILLQAYASL